MGFDEVFDTAYGADLTVIEESEEFCKGWPPAKICRCSRPAALDGSATVNTDTRNCKTPSTTRSPMQMFGAVAREYYKDPANNEGKKILSVAIMPCTAKKGEILRDESKTDASRISTTYLRPAN